MIIFIAGRTGRAGKLGTAITFLTNDDDEVMYVLSLISRLQSLTLYAFESGTTLNKVCNRSIFCSSYTLLSPRLSEISKSPVSKVPIELAKHESAQHRVTRDMKRKRDADDQE
jgi:ATP-dependent RNA helicase DDX23/PRP28